MSSDAIARVLPLYKKANELEDKGHLLRASEYFGRAAEAARALGPDNLVAVDMQRCQANALQTYVTSTAQPNTAVDPLVVAAHRANCAVLFSAITAALEFRRAAGTLLEGKCRAAEEAWLAAVMVAMHYPPARIAWLLPLIGYTVFLDAADNISYLLSNARWYAGQCSATQFQSFTQHVVHATDLMQVPRSHGTRCMSAEADFAEMLSTVMATDLRARGLDARLVQLLTAAWQRLQRSGVLEARGILDQIQQRKQSAASDRDKFGAAIDAAMTAPGLRSCALAGCGAKEAHPQHFKRCSACQAVVYCSKAHQLEDWPAHKAACKATRKAKAASTDGGAGPGAAS